MRKGTLVMRQWPCAMLPAGIRARAPRRSIRPPNGGKNVLAGANGVHPRDPGGAPARPTGDSLGAWLLADNARHGQEIESPRLRVSAPRLPDFGESRHTGVGDDDRDHPGIEPAVHVARADHPPLVRDERWHPKLGANHALVRRAAVARPDRLEPQHVAAGRTHPRHRKLTRSA